MLEFQNAEPNLSWDEAIQVVADALVSPAGTAFLMGTGSDHLFDLVSDLATATGAPAPIRFSAGSMFDGQATLSRAAEDLFGQAALPFFDIGNSDLVLSFGANFLETWLSPVAYNRAYAQMRRGNPKRRGYFHPVRTPDVSNGCQSRRVDSDPARDRRHGRAGDWQARGGSKRRRNARGICQRRIWKLISSEAGINMETLENVARHRLRKRQAPLPFPAGLF